MPPKKIRRKRNEDAAHKLIFEINLLPSIYKRAGLKFQQEHIATSAQWVAKTDK